MRSSSSSMASRYEDVDDPVNPEVIDPVATASWMSRVLTERNIAKAKRVLYKVVPQDAVSSNGALEILVNCVIFLASLVVSYKVYLVFFRGGQKLVLDLFYAPSKDKALHNLQVFIKSLTLEGIKSPAAINEILTAMGLPKWMQRYITIQAIDGAVNSQLYMTTGTEADNKIDLDRIGSSFVEAADAWGDSGVLLDYSD